MEKQHLSEITIIRSFACLSVVLLHSIKFIIGFDYQGSSIVNNVLFSIAGILAFGTPTFILISELIIAYAYPKKLPKDFFNKRLKNILIPFVVMAIFYAVIQNINSFKEISINILLNILGNYHGWFILVIFQFYLLHYFFTKYINRFNPKIVLGLSFIINSIYLSFFNFVQAPSSNKFILYLWDRGFWVPCLGWLFYFVLAYYCGKNYWKFSRIIKKNKVKVIIFLILSLGLHLYANSLGLFGPGSKRVDMIFLTISCFFTLYIIAERIKTIPYFLQTVSRYSFGIYLVHFFYLLILSKLLTALPISLGNFGIIVLFVIGITASITTVKLVNKLPLGKYAVGNISRSTKKKSFITVATKKTNASS